ncbi:MAG: hypothetical protein GX265_05215 [Mollicutes bacterium]|nr:hypothetical protein [Mollicutes bacterium]
MKKSSKQFLNKRFLLVGSYVILVIVFVILNISFSLFNLKEERELANIKVSKMKYNMTINGTSNQIITATKTS